MQNFHQSTWNHDIFYSGGYLKGQLFVKNEKYEHGGRMKVKIRIL
jgi:hypothetical protein